MHIQAALLLECILYAAAETLAILLASNPPLATCLTPTGNAHWGNPYSGQYVNRLGYACPANVEEFHTMAVLWSPTSLKYFFNGVQFHQYTSDEWFSTMPKSQNAIAPFDLNMYLILNLAIGGNYPNAKGAGPIQASDFPTRLEVDWVRVWAAPGY